MGLANTSNLELTGLGAAQGDGWMYSYAQQDSDGKICL
jgi:hypothetical protein